MFVNCDQIYKQNVKPCIIVEICIHNLLRYLFFVTAPPSNLSVIVQSEYSNDVMDDTVNCTGTIHLNTTTLRLVAMSYGTDLAAGQNITRLLLESEMTSDCRHHVFVVYTGNFSSLAGRNVSCQAADLVYGDNYFSTEEIINVKTTA